MNVTMNQAKAASGRIESGRKTITEFVTERLDADTAESRAEILEFARWAHSQKRTTTVTMVNTAVRRATDGKQGVSCKSEKDGKGNSRSFSTWAGPIKQDAKRQGKKVPKGVISLDKLGEFIAAANAKQLIALAEMLENGLQDTEARLMELTGDTDDDEFEGWDADDVPLEKVA